MSEKVKEYVDPIESKSLQLPLNGPDFSWENFQTFCEDFISLSLDTLNCHRYGGKGSKQYGIDIISDSQNGDKWAFSCKQHKKFDKSNAKKALLDTTYPADHYILLLSCDASTTVRETIKNNPKWDVWDVQDISRKVRELPSDKAKILIETHFGKSVRRRFLSLSSRSPFVTSEEFFCPLMNPNNLFNHNWKLIGRNYYLENLDAFIKTETMQVAIITGHGGIGKTKILQAFAENFTGKFRDHHLRFLLEGASINSENFDDLPVNHCIIVVDDAHRRNIDDLKILLSISRQERIKIILSLRPYALERINSLLINFGFDIHEIKELKTLNKLSRDEMIKLAHQALGNEYEHLSDRLIAVTGDNPLMTVIGGRLLAEKAISPALLECDNDFRHAALDKFQEFLLGKIEDRIDPNLCKKILDAISAVSPIRLDNGDYLRVIEEFLGIKRHELINSLDLLEESGVLLRRGYTLRITPDVLADHILHKACLTRHGQATGYSSRIFEAFESVCPERVLQNLAELDWRVNAKSDQECNLIGDVWQKIENEYRNGSNSKRFQILNVLKEVAYHQPKRVLDLIEYTICNPSSIEDEKDLITYIKHDHEDLLRVLPELLKKVSFTVDYLPRCCDILWEIGRDDNKKANAIDTLILIANYDIDKPIIFQKNILDAIIRWIKLPNAHDYLHSPLEILDQLLKKDGASHHANSRFEFVYQPFIINIESVQDIHKQVLNILEECTYSPKTKTVIRAIESLEEALHTANGHKREKDIEKEQSQWIPEQLEILKIINELTIRTTDPLIHLNILNTIRWHANHHPTPIIKEKTQAILNLIPNSFELRLMQALYNSSYVEILDEVDCGYEERLHRIDEINEALAKEFCEIFPDAVNGVNELNRCLEIFKNNGIVIQPNRFLFSISETNSYYASNACDFLIERPSFYLASYLDWLLFGIRKANICSGLNIAKRAVQSKKLGFCLAIARLYKRRWAEKPLSDDIDIIKELLVYPNLEVRQNAIGSLGSIFRSDPQVATDIIIKIYIYNYEILAEELFRLMNDRYGIPYDNFNAEQLESLLKKLEPVKEIDEHVIRMFLKYISRRLPHSLIHFLINRIEYEKRINDFVNWNNIKNWSRRYTAIPFDGLGEELASISENVEYKDMLKEIRDLVIGKNDNINSSFSKLFREISFGFNQDSLEVLDEWTNSGNKKKIEASGEILSEVSSDFIFNHSEFVANLLNSAYNAGHDTYKHICNNLFEAIVRGASITAPGEPDPKYTKLHDQTVEILGNLRLGSPEYQFYSSLKETADRSIKHGLKRDEELFD